MCDTREVRADAWTDREAFEYTQAELNVLTLAAEVRELVSLLSAQGISTRAIAPVVGVSNKTISFDRREGATRGNT